MKHYNILIIDDDPISLALMKRFLAVENYHLFTATDGQDAYEKIMRCSPNFFSCIVSDYQMPQKDGMELLQTLKKDPVRNIIPFILQTSDEGPEPIQRCLEMGAFYYLLKPITFETLRSVVKAALKDLEKHLDIHNTVNDLMRTMPLMTEAKFQFKTLAEAKSLSSLLGLLTQGDNNIGIGFFELFANAVEHGNLEITYAEKTTFLNDNTLAAEIEKRTNQVEYRDKYVEVSVALTETALRVDVTDMGKGFDFEKYLTFSMERAMDTHGRGILMAKNLSFDELNYSLGGRRVTCVIYNPQTSSNTST